ncbi:amidase family protein [Komagataeibacter medellinensis]|nr:amidase family protein [Komagataeibacter medellinensis]
MLDMTARQMIDRFADTSLSPLEYARSLVAHIERWKLALGALYAYDPQALLEAAALSEVRWQSGMPCGILDDVPVTLKELIATQDHPIPQGSPDSTLIPARANAPVADRLKEISAIIFVKTTAPDLGMLSSGFSTFHTLILNPWELSCNPDGSSAGAAAGYGPLGFKLSLGRIPVDPYYTGRCASPMTRTVGDAALMMNALAMITGPPGVGRNCATCPKANWGRSRRSSVHEPNAAGMSTERVLDGLGKTFAMRRACIALFGDVDAVLSPITPNISFPAENAGPTNDPERSFEHIVYTVPWNISEQPAISINCGFSSTGMPIGHQIIAPRFADLTVLKMATTYEVLRGSMPRWPQAPST